MWLGLSLAAHVALLVLLARAPTPPPRTLPPVSLRLLTPPPPAPAPLPSAPSPHARPAAPSSPEPEPEPEPAPALQPDPSAPSTPIVALSPGTLAALSRPSGGTISQQTPDEPSVDAKVRAGVTTRWSSQQARKHGPRGVLAQVGNTLRERFQPLPSLNHRDLGKAGAIGRQMLNEFLATTKLNNPVDRLKHDLAPIGKTRELTAHPRPTPDTVWDDIKLRICMGACGQDHEIARLTAIIRVDHDARGAPLRAALEKSSGHIDFDDYCLGAISLKLEVPHLPGEPVPEWSMWRFDQVVYRFSRAERILDPAFKPPGRKDNDRSDIFGDASVTAEVALLAVTYRDPASLPGVLK